MADYSSKYSVVKKNPVLGCGGNGEVRKATCIQTGELVALKCLNEEAKTNSEKKLRFEDEINTMLLANRQIKGIIPILDYSIEDGWYVMPIADTINNHCGSIEEIVSGVIQIAEVLVDLHKIGLSHRDIKPGNMLFYDGRWVLCDFGLVDIQDNPHNLTKNSSRVGAQRTMAPEMSRYAKDADGTKADVYSLAKSLWILLTNNKDGFEGRYDVTDDSISLHKYTHLRKEYLVEVDELLDIATQNAPEDRLDIVHFVKLLREWQETNKNTVLQQVKTWNFIKKYLFRGSGPQRCTWEDPVEIVRVMNVLSLLPLTSHLFFPDKGWMEYQKVEIGTEAGCLDIYTDIMIYRVKLGCLQFESFYQPYWNYLMLEAEPLETVVGDQCDEFSELVIEDKPGCFVSAKDVMYGVYDYDSGKKLPDNYKILTRYLKGKFLVVLKSGPYNRISSTIDGRHANCTSDEFRRYIEELQKLYVLKGLIEDKAWIKLKDFLIDKCPFKPQSKMLKTAQQDESDPDFVKKNWQSFYFGSVLKKTEEMPVGRAKYRFVFRLSSSFNPLDFAIDDSRLYLCQDGKIKQFSTDFSNVYEVSDREEASLICHNIREIISNYCDGKVSVFEQPSCSIEIVRNGVPSHLFEKEDIKKLMLVADDRVNNTLVIDEDGFPQIVGDDTDADVYPVVGWTWFARRVNVGKYSNLPDLDSIFHYSLAKWYEYLATGIGQHRQDYDDCVDSENQLIEKIKAIYGSEVK